MLPTFTNKSKSWSVFAKWRLCQNTDSLSRNCLLMEGKKTKNSSQNQIFYNLKKKRMFGFGNTVVLILHGSNLVSSSKVFSLFADTLFLMRSKMMSILYLEHLWKKLRHNDEDANSFIFLREIDVWRKHINYMWHIIKYGDKTNK